MNEYLLYDYQYDVAAIIAITILLTFLIIRRTSKTITTKAFIAVMICDLLAAIFDAISCFAISFPHRFPLWINYVSALGYLLFYNMISVIYFMYVVIKADARSYATKMFMIVCSVFYFVTIISSPWTHFIAYFDGDLNYKHGPFMTVLYVIPFITFIWEIFILIGARKKFNLYQIGACIGLIIAMAVGTIIQAVWSRLLVGTMLCALIMFFIYISFENPAVYTYRDTQCSNRPAFIQKHIEYKNKKEKYDIIPFSIEDYNVLLHSHGQLYMDRVNVKIADLLYHNFKEYAYYMAVGKFLLMVPTRKELTEKFVERLKTIFSSPIIIEGDEIKVPVTIGKLLGMDETFETEDIEGIIEHHMSNPDSNMSARELYDKMVSKRLRREKLIHIIRRAIANDEFKVFYQPIRDVAAGKYVSAEALLRLNDAELGFINPEEVVTLAEECGYINKIGEMVFEKVCRFIKEGHLEELGIHYIEINLSPVQCAQSDLIELFESIMKKYDIRPEQINLEITETAEISDASRMMMNIDELGKKGIAFSIDDYGSGFASADYLIKLPVSIVKIDKLILWEAMKERNAMFVLINTMHMIHDLGRKIVVEGVENEDMVKVLTANRCDYMQGYYYSKPLPMDAFVEFLKNNNTED